MSKVTASAAAQPTTRRRTDATGSARHTHAGLLSRLVTHRGRAPYLGQEKAVDADFVRKSCLPATRANKRADKVREGEGKAGVTYQGFPFFLAAKLRCA